MVRLREVFFEMFTKFLIVLIILCAITASAQPPIKRFEYKYSFKPPYLAQRDGSIPFWEYGGSKSLCTVFTAISIHNKLKCNGYSFPNIMHHIPFNWHCICHYFTLSMSTVFGFHSLTIYVHVSRNLNKARRTSDIFKKLIARVRERGKAIKCVGSFRQKNIHGSRSKKYFSLYCQTDVIIMNLCIHIIILETWHNYCVCILWLWWLFS